MSLDEVERHYLSLGIVIEENVVTKVFDELYDELIAILIPICVLLGVFIFGVVLSGYV